MNTAVEIVSGLGVLLVTLFILKKRKKCSSCSSEETSINKTKSSEEEKPVIKSAANIVAHNEETAVNPQIANVAAAPEVANKPVSHNIETSAKPPVKEVVENNDSGFPQDSILKRHYLHYLCNMIEALAPQCPTDSVLRRHYHAMLETQINQCLNDKKTIDRLIDDYHRLSA